MEGIKQINQDEIVQEAVKSENLFVSKESLDAYKGLVEMMADSGRRLEYLMRARNEDGMSLLMDENDVGRASSLMRQLMEVDLQGPQDLEEVSALLSGMMSCYETIGTIRSDRFRDDIDNLGAVSNALRALAENSEDLARHLNNMGTEESIQLAKKAGGLTDVLLDRRMAVLKRMDLVGQYLGV